MLRLLLLVMALLFLLPAATAQAANCTVDIDDMDFGVIDTLGTSAAVSSAPIDVQCDGILPGVQRITLCGYIGAGSGGDIAGLRLATSTGGGTLAFGLYASAGVSIPWGITTSIGVGLPQRLVLPVSNGNASGGMTLYGMVPVGQATASTGAYLSNFTQAEVMFQYREGDLACPAVIGGSEARDSFAVTGNVPANCRLETSDLSFGTTGRIGENIEAEAELGLVCTAGTGYAIAIDGGGSGDPSQRRLTSGGNTIRYELYSNAQRTIPWGMETESMVPGDGDGIEQPYRVYGRIPPQPAAAGSYSDTVVVTIFYD